MLIKQKHLYCAVNLLMMGVYLRAQSTNIKLNVLASSFFLKHMNNHHVSAYKLCVTIFICIILRFLGGWMIFSFSIVQVNFVFVN